ncbi:MAG: MFS transporter [Deltaproteobacteria bacterium]|nr:MFS transporter [Deltaproteobacteria bacterium]
MSDKFTQWFESAKAFTHPRVVTMLFYGFSAGIPILLIFSSLSLWLREAGLERSAVTYFSWAALGYSFKFVWAPLVDRISIPLLTQKLGRRRSWILFSQLLIMAAIAMMALSNPTNGTNALTIMALGAVFLGFSSATQDIVIDAYRIESAGSDLQAMMSSSYIAGYRIGMITAGAGALYLAQTLGSSMESYSYAAWKWTYLIVALTMSVGIVTTLMIQEPEGNQRQSSDLSTQEMIRFLVMFAACVGAFIAIFVLTKTITSDYTNKLQDLLGNQSLASFLVELVRLALTFTATYLVAKILMTVKVVEKQVFHETYIAPVKDFFVRYRLQGPWFLLLLIAFYRISDIVLGVIANVFYQDMGFSKIEIAAISKTFGLIMTISGGFLGGILTIRMGVLRVLLLGAVLSAATNLLYMGLSYMGHAPNMLIAVIVADNLAAGLSLAAYIAFLSALTNIKFTAMQYAIFSSIMTLFPKIIGGYSGSMVDAVGYPTFFLLTAIMGIPVIALIIKAKNKVELDVSQ